MRKAFSNVQFIEEDDGQFYGISLGYDFTAEHEWGIKGIHRHFNMDNTKNGIKGRIIKKGKDTVLIVEDDKMCILTSREPWDKKDKYTTKDLLPHDLSGTGELETAWDENDFCIVSTNKDDFPKLYELYEHFQKKNIAICFINSAVPAFSNASLSILIADKLPKDVTDAMSHVDTKQDDLVKYEEKIGVTKLKDKAKENYSYKGDKYYMACSPKWIDYEDEENREKKKKEHGTKYDIMFWVNYSDDDDNYGWYTAEQIIKWLSTPGLKLKSLNKTTSPDVKGKK